MGPFLHGYGTQKDHVRAMKSCRNLIARSRSVLLIHQNGNKRHIQTGKCPRNIGGPAHDEFGLEQVSLVLIESVVVAFGVFVQAKEHNDDGRKKDG